MNVCSSKSSSGVCDVCVSRGEPRCLSSEEFSKLILVGQPIEPDLPPGAHIGIQLVIAANRERPGVRPVRESLGVELTTAPDLSHSVERAHFVPAALSSADSNGNV